MRRSFALAAALLVSPLAHAQDDDEYFHVEVPATPSIKKDATPGERVSAEFLVGTWVSDAKASAHAAAPDMSPEMAAQLEGVPMPATTYRFTKTTFEETQSMGNEGDTPYRSKGTWTLSKDGRSITLVPSEGEERTLGVSKRGARLAVDAGFMVLLFNKK